MKKHLFLNSLLIVFMLMPCLLFSQSGIILGNHGKVHFTSEAAMELIEATSDKLNGAIDKSKNSFAFVVEINSFRGFNGELQRQHFHEDYMETDKFPQASFSGKFIEQVDFSVNGSYEVRAKGFFTVHGIQKERIIKGLLTVKNDRISIDGAFTILLENHDIKVPKIVYEKIAQEIKVEIYIQFKQ